MMNDRIATLLAVAGLAGIVAGCAIATAPPDRPTSTGPSAPRTSSRPVNPEVAQRLQRLMVPLVKHMDRPIPLNQVRVGILDSEQINAANAGGGEFYVTRGLLERAGDAQLQGVLAHELAHADLNHVAKAQTLATGLSVGVIVLDQIIPGSRAITPLAGELVARAYSRQEEYAADRHGAAILTRAGQDGRRMMIDTLTWLQSTAGGGAGGFLATHPATGDRIQALRDQR